MTLAGTRPILQDELQKYELHHRARIAIKPGITGMWQVSGRSDITDFEEVVRLDRRFGQRNTAYQKALNSLEHWNHMKDLSKEYQNDMKNQIIMTAFQK